MTLKELNKQIKTKANDIFEQVFPTLKVRLSEQGLDDNQIKQFTVFDRIKQQIETHLVQNILSALYEKNADQLEFWESEIKDIILEVELRSQYLYAESSEFFARMSITGIPMNEGWVANDCLYFATEDELTDYLRSIQEKHEESLTDTQLKESRFEDGAFYYTEWYDPEDIQFVKYNGNIIPINN